MTLLRLSFKEWQRRPLRTAITTAGVAIAIAALFSLLSLEQGYRQGVQTELGRLGAHILVVPKGCPYDAASIALHGASWPCYLDQAYLQEVRATPGVASSAPALMGAFYDSQGQHTVYVGIDTNMLRLKTGWRIQGQFPSRPGEVLAGSTAARQAHWSVGQQVVLPGLRNATASISGILRQTGGADDTFIFTRLPDAQSWLKRPGQLSHILVRLNDPNDLDRVVGQLRGCNAGLYMNVVPLGYLFRSIQNVVNSTRLLFGVIALVAILAAAAGVSNTVLMAVAERTREIGMLRAIGASPRQIFGLFWLETLQVCLVGAGLGIVAAFAGSWQVEAWLRSRLPFAPTEALIRWQPGLVIISLGCALVVGSLAGLIPAWRAALLQPVEAIRRKGASL